ncbi:hypothetical protein MTO96_000744 [Rhipicephalus appendiculatus]
MLGDNPNDLATFSTSLRIGTSCYFMRECNSEKCRERAESSLWSTSTIPASTWGEPHDFQVQMSAGVMHQLLKHHRCVASLGIASFQFQWCVQPLRDALPYSRLRKLKMTCLSSLMSDGLWAAIPALTTLEELDCSVFCCCSNYRSNELSSALATLVRTSPSLVVVSLAGISMEEQATKDLLGALTENGVLRELSLGMWVIPETCGKELARYLVSSPSLVTLSYTGDSEKTEVAVLEAILNNRTMSKVIISTFTGHVVSITLVASILSKNAAIRSFEIGYIHEEVSQDHQNLYDIWLEALKENDALEELSFPCEIWSRQQWTRLKAIISSKHHLKRFNVRSDIENYEFLKDVCHALEDSDVHNKVFCGDYLVEESIDLLKCKMFSGLHFVDAREDVKVTALRQLLDCDHLTSLVLQIPSGNLAVCSALAEYVQSTSVLRKLEARTEYSDEQDFPDDWWHTIGRSLSKNESIRELAFHAHNMSDSGVAILAQAVKASGNIRKLTFGDTSMTSLRAFVNRLSADIAQNHTLLGVVLEGRLDQGWLDAFRNVFAISEATRRNSDLLAAAAAFPKATEMDRRSAAALERIYKLHAVLLEDLAELVEVSVAEIGGMAHRHLQRTAGLDQYMRTTGVVKERVACHPRDDGRMQLDDLGEDVWGLVRRFLMLDDVKEAVPHPENL